jgi:hypothetical protein
MQGQPVPAPFGPEDRKQIAVLRKATYALRAFLVSATLGFVVTGVMLALEGSHRFRLLPEPWNGVYVWGSFLMLGLIPLLALLYEVWELRRLTMIRRASGRVITPSEAGIGDLSWEAGLSAIVRSRSWRWFVYAVPTVIIGYKVWAATRR